MKEEKLKSNEKNVGANGFICAMEKIISNKTNANIIGGAPLGELTFEEPIQNKKSTKNRSNLISKHQPLISDHKGITLIALVITIIVMLILVGVTVTVALNGGLFNQAKKAVSDTQNAVDKENELSTGKVQIGDKWYNSLEDYLNAGKWKLSEDGNSVTDGIVTVAIGDYVNYKPDSETTTYSADKLGADYTGYANTGDLTTQTELNWRILGVDEKGCLTIISDKPTSKTVYFQGAKGYNNGVYILNDICKTLYSSTDLGVTARSLTIEDVEGGFDTLVEKARDSYTSPGVVTYNQPRTYTGSSAQYPAIYAKENGSGIGVEETNQDEGRKTDGIGVSEAYYNEGQLNGKPQESYTTGSDDNKPNTSLTCTQTYYYWSNPSCKSSDFSSMIFSTGTDFWLASRYACCSSDATYFGLLSVEATKLYGWSMFHSNGWVYSKGYYLRPAVSIGSDITLTLCEGDNSDTNPHTLSKVSS